MEELYLHLLYFILVVTEECSMLMEVLESQGLFIKTLNKTTNMPIITKVIPTLYK